MTQNGSPPCQPCGLARQGRVYIVPSRCVAYRVHLYSWAQAGPFRATWSYYCFINMPKRIYKQSFTVLRSHGPPSASFNYKICPFRVTRQHLSFKWLSKRVSVIPPLCIQVNIEHFWQGAPVPGLPDSVLAQRTEAEVESGDGARQHLHESPWREAARCDENAGSGLTLTVFSVQWQLHHCVPLCRWCSTPDPSPGSPPTPLAHGGLPSWGACEHHAWACLATVTEKQPPGTVGLSLSRCPPPPRVPALAFCSLGKPCLPGPRNSTAAKSFFAFPASSATNWSYASGPLPATLWSRGQFSNPFPWVGE